MRKNNFLTPSGKTSNEKNNCSTCESCAICLSPLQTIYCCDDPDQSDFIVKTKCNHSFHEFCLQEVKARKAECPLCRTILSPSGIDNSILSNNLNITENPYNSISLNIPVQVDRNAVISAATRGRNAVRLALLQRQRQQNFHNNILGHEIVVS